ncbi:alpha/beta fold hydrolase [Lacisediminihabitans profunda]|uniref:Alpha/beta hydrolase n=1 Tax=Lacisediminihabitans profunda TaxID=2594790 RepID=A0A5C8USU1_9MICO|nr:alpha/beta hydrolase [Lacisediminihabitans profunda]TXN30588.1 alpha/beta hydrolase [Lacisediminihabitans profunda]
MSTTIVESSIATNGTNLNVAIAGSGPALLLMHGFPHTWRLWDRVIPVLAETHTVIAPDLRGLGASDRETRGFDARTLAADMLGLLDALGHVRADVAAIDAGAQPAFMLALEHPERVTRLVLMEALIGPLPGASAFLADGAPWWFGFHAVPGLAESIIAGHEGEYLDFFYTTGTHEHQGIPPVVRDSFVAAYQGRESLRCGFEYYRSTRTSGQQILTATSSRRLTVPTVTIGANTVGEATFGQLQPLTDHLEGRIIPNCGHIIPLDQPEELTAHLTGIFA